MKKSSESFNNKQDDINTKSKLQSSFKKSSHDIEKLFKEKT